MYGDEGGEALNCLNAPFSSFSRACHAEHRRWKCKSAKLKLVASGRCVCSSNARIRMCSRTSRRQTACASPGWSNCQLQRLPFKRRPMVTEMMPPVIDCKCWGVAAVNETHTHASVEERKCRGKKAEREREREVCGAKGKRRKRWSAEEGSVSTVHDSLAFQHRHRIEAN